MHVISLPSDPGVGGRLASVMRCTHSRVWYKAFPDGELYLRLPSQVSEPIILVLTTYPEQNRSLMELLFAVEYFSFKGFKELHVVAPYLAYSRQDKEFLEGEVVSGRALLRILTDLGVRKLFVVDIHSDRLKEEFSDLVVNVAPARTFADYVRKTVKPPYILLAPDVGASKRVETIAKLLECNHVVVSKFRDRVTGEVTHRIPEEVNVRGINVVIIDDIISTGGTVVNLVEYLVRQGAGDVYVIASHGLFVGDALKRLSSSGVNRVVVLNTVNYRVSSGLVEYLDVTEEILESVRNTLEK
ncbi:MAG: ribose-phosphate diphosphokinase [Zestosphaera sp.]